MKRKKREKILTAAAIYNQIKIADLAREVKLPENVTIIMLRKLIQSKLFVKIFQNLYFFVNSLWQ